jgi:hypothetical protein
MNRFRVKHCKYPIILGAQGLGVWSTSGRVDGQGSPVQLTGTDVGEIKGWMVPGDIAASYKIPLAEMLVAFKLPADTPATAAIKDLEGQGENFSTTTLRSWIAARLGSSVPVITPSTGTKSGSGGGPGTKTPSTWR